jgi:hypothetical protein
MRTAFLALLALVSGILLSRRQVSLKRECGLEIACTSCSKKKHCKWVEDEKG